MLCVDRDGDVIFSDKNYAAEAIRYQKLKDYANACKSFERADDPEGAAACCEILKKYSKAVKYHMESGNFKRAIRLSKKIRNTNGVNKCRKIFQQCLSFSESIRY